MQARRWAQLVGVTVAASLLAACQDDEPEALAPGMFGPDLVEQQRTICEGDGGRWAPGGQAGNFVCYVTPPDANQSCSASSDCEGMCLARSRTCAPVTPFFGCHEVLNSSGARQTLCVE